MSVKGPLFQSLRGVLLLVATAALAACKAFSGNLHTPDERHFPDRSKHVDKAAVIEISAPQIYSRESLINDRRDEQDYLEELLAASRSVRFPPELARDLSTITALALDLGLAFDPTKALEAEAAKEQFGLASERERLELEQELEELEMRAEARELRHQVDLAKLEIELEKLKQQLEQVRAAGGETDGGGESSSESESGDTGGAAPSFPEIEAPESRLAELREVTDSLLERLRTRTDLPRKAAVETDPREEFRARQAYRQDLRAALAEARLDDVHDLGGRALYRLQFQATVAPGEHKGKWGVARLSLTQPKEDPRTFLYALYRTWLSHATYRLNQTATRRGAEGRIKDPIYRTLAMGSNLYSIRSVFYDPRKDRRTVLDLCDYVQSERKASLRGCKSFLLAMPLLADEALGAHFPGVGVRAIMLRFFVDELKEDPLIVEGLKEDPQTRWRAAWPQLILEKEVESGACEPEFLKKGNSETPETTIRNIVDLAKEIIRRAQELEFRKYEDHLEVFQENLESVKELSQQDSKDFLEAEKSISRALELGSELQLRDWLEIFPPQDSLKYAIAVSSASRSAAASLQGLRSRRALPEVEREKITLLLQSLTETAQKAKGFIDLLRKLNGCSDKWGREALWSALDYQEIGGDVADVFFKALLPARGEFAAGEDALADRYDPVQKDWESCWNCFGSSLSSCECVLGGRASVHATAPEQLSQQVSTVASATRALQVAASIAGSFPAEGTGAEAALGLAKGATGQVEALERVPLVVGFSSDRVPDPGEFGWVFGPRATVDPEEDQIRLTQTLSTYTVTADLLVPVWWPYVEMGLETGWVGNWHDDELLHLENGETRRIKKDLPLNRADLDNLTAVIAKEVLGHRVQQTEIYEVYPNEISLCNDEITFLIYGANVWRSSDIYLGGVRSKEGSIQVLPDMEGVAATFDLTRLAKKSSKQTNPSLWVWTQNGFDSWELELTGVIGKDGKCTDVAAHPTVSPSKVSRCSDSVTFAVETMSFEADAAFLGSEAHVKITPRKPAEASPSDKTVGHLIRFTNLTGKNKGLDAWPLTLIAADGKVLSTEIGVVGSAEDCSKQPATPTPSLEPALPEEGALNVCAPLDSVTLIGSGADQVTKATFLDFTSTGVDYPSKDTVVISFPDLRRYTKPEEVPAKAELRFVAGGKEYPLEVRLKCKM